MYMIIILFEQSIDQSYIFFFQCVSREVVEIDSEFYILAGVRYFCIGASFCCKQVTFPLNHPNLFNSYTLHVYRCYDNARDLQERPFDPFGHDLSTVMYINRILSKITSNDNMNINNHTFSYYFGSIVTSLKLQVSACFQHSFFFFQLS